MNNYYNVNATSFFNDTVNVDMTSLYNKFIPLIEAQGSILDAGCGSARDSLYFKTKGFNVHSFDASEVLAEKASQLLQQNVEVTTFQEFQSSIQFDGIWACASLLHVPKEELSNSIANLAMYLKVSGIFYMSFKYGDTERQHNGRNFTDVDETVLSELLKNTPELTLKETWITGDARPGRDAEKWLNVLLTKVNN